MSLPRIAVTVALSLLAGWILTHGWESGASSILIRAQIVGFTAMIVFTIFERWPRRVPPWIARWVLQVVAVAVSIPITTTLIWYLSTREGAPQFWEVQARLQGWMLLTFLSLVFAPWTALAALVRQREAFAREQALAFELERSELERQALDARLHLLQGQVTPHFLFNTLANVQALVDAGSPRASAVLRSLVSYLRAAVPLLDEPFVTMRRELELVRAYLELMHMRMPDRLRFEIDADEGTLDARCPPTAILTLVENAVRHGVDPSEDGGTVRIEVRRAGERCLVRVIDSGVGLHDATRGLGTGLSSLRERLQLMFGENAALVVKARDGGGVVSEIDIPHAEGAR